MEQKRFKCKDEVVFAYRVRLYKHIDGKTRRRTEDEEWSAYRYSIFSHYERDKEGNEIPVLVTGMLNGCDCIIVPYDGNEHLVGTYPERLKDGEIIVISVHLEDLAKGFGAIARFRGLTDERISAEISDGSFCKSKYCIKFSDFKTDGNPDEMKKLIMAVENGKLVKALSAVKGGGVNP